MTCASKKSVRGILLELDDFGQTTDSSGNTVTIKRFTWTNSNKVSVQLITYGGYITSVKIPDSQGNVEDVVIGFDTLEGYLSTNNTYFGATIGRCANRIKRGLMTIEGVSYQLATNDGLNHLHGGIKGFDKVIWDYYVAGTKVVLSYHGADLEEGYPGDVVVNVTFELTGNNELVIDYKATTNKPTCVNLTNHSYFNLAGHDKGATELYKHVVSINADKITEVESDGIPTGELPDVSGTIFDLRIPTVLGDVIQKVPDSPGYDHNFCVTKGTEEGNTFVAKVTHPDSGRTIEVYSNQPGVQFYTGNFLPEDDSLVGKGGSIYRKHGTFCLETQIYPDAINNPQFGKSVLYPGELYHHTATFKFLVS
uniref:Aldose 1-epimerase n=1 Tax=Monochamus alternatus TaxID=192382 RepID=A0A6H1XQS7_MONAT|nr:aldose-1-epimerase [Monochamus alternatus]